jgi:hypothetical protein
MATLPDLSRDSLLAIEQYGRAGIARSARGIARRAVSATLQTTAGERINVDVAADLDASPLLLAAASLAGQIVELVYAAEAGEHGCAMTLQGELQPMREEPSLGRYIARFCQHQARLPESLPEGGQALFHLQIAEARLSPSDGPEQVLDASTYLLPVDAPDHTDKEWDNLAHQNYQHLDINEQLVSQLLEMPAGRWVLTGLDPEGMNFRLGDRRVRLPFPEPAYTYAEMGKFIKIYVTEARTRLGFANPVPAD